MMLSTAASTVMYASSMTYTSPPTVTSGTILYNGLQLEDKGSNILTQQASHLPAKLKMQGKGQLDNQLQEWQMRQEAQKQVERAVTAHRLTIERNMRIIEMGAIASTQKSAISDKAGNLQGNSKERCMPFDSALVDTSQLIMVPSFVPISPLVYPPGTISTPLYCPVQELANISVLQTQYNNNNANAELPQAQNKICNIPTFPLPGTSRDAWLNWHQTTSPTLYIRTESATKESRSVPYNHAQMPLDYLPFTSEDEITKQQIDESISDPSLVSCDSDDEEYLVVYC